MTKDSPDSIKYIELGFFAEVAACVMHATAKTTLPQLTSYYFGSLSTVLKSPRQRQSKQMDQGQVDASSRKVGRMHHVRKQVLQAHKIYEYTPADGLPEAAVRVGKGRR